MPFAVSDTVILASITGSFGLLSTAVAGYIAFVMARLEKQNKDTAKEQAAKVEEVKTTLEATTTKQDEKLEAIAKTGEEAQRVGALTHDLVNSASLVQLGLYAVATRRIADLTHDPADIEAAKTAEKLHHEHAAKAEQATKNDEARTEAGQANSPPGGKP